MQGPLALLPFALAGALFANPAIAADRALLVGVGEYRSERVNDLPGIDLDIATMERVARRLGFDEASTRVLGDADATLGNFDRTMREWLVEGVGADDRVLIYFSGHGSQVRDLNGDEPDGLDEILVMHDYDPEVEGPVPGALVDDRFYQLLEEIPTDDVLLIVDACHSGSGYKSIAGSLTGAVRGVPKTHRSGLAPSAPEGAPGELFTVAEKGRETRFAAMMAAADNQVAIATDRGSLFTLGVAAAVEEASASERPVTPRDIVRLSGEFVRAALENSPNEVFTPQLGGSEQLADKPVRFAQVNPRRASVEAMVAGKLPLVVKANKATYRLGDRSLRIGVKVPEAGFLNIITVDPEGATVVLYPNRLNPDNRVAPGTLVLPTPEMEFDLIAQEPLGEQLIAAFLTGEPLNLFEGGFGERDAAGKLLVDFAELSEFGARAFGVVEHESDEPMRAGSVVVGVEP